MLKELINVSGNEIDDVGSILPMSPGKAKRYHDEYAKNGSCCVLLAFEPHTGIRYVGGGVG